MSERTERIACQYAEIVRPFFRYLIVQRAEHTEYGNPGALSALVGYGVALEVSGHTTYSTRKDGGRIGRGWWGLCPLRAEHSFIFPVEGEGGNPSTPLVSAYLAYVDKTETVSVGPDGEVFPVSVPAFAYPLTESHLPLLDIIPAIACAVR